MVQIRSKPDAPTPASPRALDRKRAILEAAGRAFRARGFHATSMRDIAAELGMTVGNLYYYFDSKHALLAFCQHETLDRLLSLVAPDRRPGEDAATRLRRIIVGHIVCLHDALPGAIAHLSLDPLPEADRARCIERRDRYESALRDLVREGIADGIFSEIDEKIAVWTILGAVNGTALWFRSEGPRSATTLGERMADQLIRGLLTDRTAPNPTPAAAHTSHFADAPDSSSQSTPHRRFS